MILLLHLLDLIDTVLYRATLCPNCHSWRIMGKHLFSTCERLPATR